MRPITKTSKTFYVTINILKLLTSLTGLSALSTFGDSESEIGSSSYICQYKLFIRFKDYSYNNVVQYIIHNINQHYILDALGTQKEPRKIKDKLEGQLKLFNGKMLATCHPKHGPVEGNGLGLCSTTDIQRVKLKLNWRQMLGWRVQNDIPSLEGELTPSPKDQRSSSKIKGNGMQN